MEGRKDGRKEGSIFEKLTKLKKLVYDLIL